jgi:hypothetical protein
MPRYSLFIQRFPYGGVEASECVSWLMRTYHQALTDRRFERVACDWLNDTPITMTRNRAMRNARRQGFDFLLMVDSDMSPDHELLVNGDASQEPFFDVAVDALIKSPKPAIIAAPYVGPPPLENVYVFQWANRGNTRHPQAGNARLDQFTREQAAMLAGVQEVGALPTGLMLMDLRCLDTLPEPWTYYEYKGSGPTECDACHQRHRGPEEEKASTEDVTFTRDAGLNGTPILCAWSSWAGHVKRYVGGKPRPYTTDVVAHKMRDAIKRGVLAGEQEIVVETPDWLKGHVAAVQSAAAEAVDGLRESRAAVAEAARRGLDAANARADAEVFLSGLDRTAQVAEVVFDGQAVPQVAATGQPWLDHMPPADPTPQPAPPPPVPLTLTDLVAGVPLG